MKTVSFKIVAFMVLLAALSLVSCFRTRPKFKPINPAFAEHISGYTSGMISRRATILIELTEGVLPQDMVLAADSKQQLSEKETKELFSFSPSIKGKAAWISDRVIEFTPYSPLPVNQFYEAEFNLSKVKKVKSELETFPFQFCTYPQNLTVTIDGIRNYDNLGEEWRKITGKLSTSDKEDTALIKRCLSAEFMGQKLEIDWQFEEERKEFYFVINNIERKEKQDFVTITWNGKPIGAFQTGQEKVAIPALGEFSVLETTVLDGLDQTVVITFSDPLQKSQDLKGLIKLSNVGDFTYATDGNTLSIYPAQHFSGESILSLASGIKNFKGYVLKTDYINTLTFYDPSPSVRLKGNGCILPNSKGLIFPFESISLKSVDVRIIKIFESNVHQFLQVNSLEGEDELSRVGKIIVEQKVKLDYDKNTNLKQWNKHVLDLSKFIAPDPGAIYRVCIKFSKEDYVCNCPKEEEDEQINYEEEAYYLKESDPDWNEDNWHSGGFSGYDTWSYYDGERNPCSKRYYYGKAVCSNLLASDLGLIYKQEEDKTTHAFVTNMITAKPVFGAVVEYYDYTRQLIASGSTDENGMLTLKLKRKPFIMMVKHGKQRGYLKLLEGYSNSLSKFNVEGEYIHKGVKGYTYAERGVWRPGDSIYVNFMLEDKLNQIPDNHPVKLDFIDPNGQVVTQITRTQSINGHYDFPLVTRDDAITGTYRAVIKVGNKEYPINLKVETIKPNRLKIYFKEISDTSATLAARWLHGAKANNLKATVNVTVNQASTSMEKYKGFEFDSPLRVYHSDAETIFEGPLDGNGEGLIATKVKIGTDAPGTLRLNYFTKVFEESGDFSIDRFTTLYSPYKTYIGMETPSSGNYDGTYIAGNNYPFNVVAVNKKGDPVANTSVRVKVYKLEWRWWYDTEEDDLANYVARGSSEVVKDTVMNISNGKGKFYFGIKYPEYGRYLITVTDLKGGHQAGSVLYFDWPYWSRANRKNNENATMLNFATDKEVYRTGESIKISFPSAADGMALVSVETSSKVLYKSWIKTNKGETRHEIKATAAMAPNAYIHLTLVQPHASTVNDLPIRMYGIVPVMVENPATHLTPVITMSETLRPETVTNIAIKEKDGKPMSYTLAVVDEGLLDLTRFKTPQPWTTFYAKEALGITTWDMYDYVIGAYAGKLDKMLSIGGDGDGMNGKGVKASRFKPMVKHLGPFYLNAGEQRMHKVAIPNYIGSVRVMVVAGGNAAYGNAEKTVTVKKPLMVLATLPRVLSPAESVVLPVDVFAMEKHVKEVVVKVETNDLLSIEGSSTGKVLFTEAGDKVVNFKLNVAERIGLGKVKVIVQCGKEIATQEIEIGVRAPNPVLTRTIEKNLSNNEEWKAQISTNGIMGTNNLTVEVSSLPAIGLEKRLNYLIQYPHGCIEQTTSSVFPQLVLHHLIDLKEKRSNEVATNIKAALQRLRLFQTTSGGFSYWPGEQAESEWGTNYAGHFLIAAEKQGYALPIGMKNKWIKYQKNLARNWSSASATWVYFRSAEGNASLQAYRLYTLALSGNADLGAMNRLREETRLGETAKWHLAAAYYLCGQTEVSQTLTSGLYGNLSVYKELSYTYGSDVRDKAIVLECAALIKNKTVAATMLKQLCSTLNSETWLSTQETGYSLLAISNYLAAAGASGAIQYSIKVGNNPVQNITSARHLVQVTFNQSKLDKHQELWIQNALAMPLYIKVINQGIPLQGDLTTYNNNVKLKVEYVDLHGKTIDVTRIKQGMDFKAVVTITNPGTKGLLKEMTLNQLFPSGWEIRNNRLDGLPENTAIRYQDIRDDRVYSYYDIGPNSTSKVCIELNATYLGRFYLPAVSTEAMYNNTIAAYTAGRWVEVVKE